MERQQKGKNKRWSRHIEVTHVREGRHVMLSGSTKGNLDLAFI